jgi:hypothetical protein
VVVWEALVKGTYPPDKVAAMSEMLPDLQQAAAQVGAEINLLHYLTGSWPGAPSALVAPQSARLTFVSDMIFAPVGLSMQLRRIAPAPWQQGPLEVKSVWVAVLLAARLAWARHRYETALAATRPMAGETAHKRSGLKGLPFLFATCA